MTIEEQSDGERSAPEKESMRGGNKDIFKHMDKDISRLVARHSCSYSGAWLQQTPPRSGDLMVICSALLCAALLCAQSFDIERCDGVGIAMPKAFLLPTYLGLSLIYACMWKL